MFLELINDPASEPARINLDVEGDLRQRVANASPAPSARDFRLVIPQQEYGAMMRYHENEFRSFAGFDDPATQETFLRVVAQYLGVGDVKVRSGV